MRPISKHEALTRLAGLFLLSCPVLWCTAAPVPSVSIGQNFTASTYNINVVALPPDGNGAVGPQYFVEFINGAFAIYSKANGQNVKRVTDLHFWSSAGVVISPDDVTTDPRVVYDPAAQRWFASMVDANATSLDPTLNANDFLLAVSDSSDPTGGWHGFLFPADPVAGNFADFPTLGVDNAAVYLGGDFFHGSSSPVGSGLVSIPKAGLLAATPSIADRTWLGTMDPAVWGEVLQPAVCLDGSATGKVLATSDIGSDGNPHSNLVGFTVQNAGGPNAFLSPPIYIPTEPWLVPDNVDFGEPLLVAMQPDGTSNLMANDARFSATAYAVGGIIYAVHSTEVNNRVAIRWYRVRASDEVLLESGTIADPNLDLFFPSIAANPYGVVTIAFNGSGLSTPVSCFAIVGQTADGVTTFGDPVLLQSGASVYHGDDELLAELLGQPPFSRWGDYSATSIDPSDPNRFWTIQMYPSDFANEDVWSTRVTELIVVAPKVSLAIRREGTNVTLSWPSAFAGYQLQFATNLHPPANWENVTQPPLTNGNQVVVTLPALAPAEFFRLQGP